MLFFERCGQTEFRNKNARARGVCGVTKPLVEKTAVWLKVWLNLQLGPKITKDLEHFCAKSLIYMVGVKGFEPSTPCTPCKCATRLRHTP